MGELAVTLTVDQLRALIREAVAESSAPPSREVLTLAECAELLHRHPKVVMQCVRERGLPAHFISEREPRFIRCEVLEWLRDLKLPPSGKDT